MCCLQQSISIWGLLENTRVLPILHRFFSFKQNKTEAELNNSTMVVFICDGCQESLSRAKVKAHSVRCNSQVVSCVDCGRRFEGAEYEKHISCVSESQKYTGKTDKKQDEWANCVLEAVSLVEDPTAAKAFENIVARIGPATVPKKKQKFVNLCKSSHGNLKEGTVSQIWNAIERVKKNRAEAREAEKQSAFLKQKESIAEEPKVTTAIITETAEDEEERELNSQRKLLKKALKKVDGEGLLLKDLVEEFGRKKTVKRIVRQFPNEFEIEKGESGKKVKLR